MWGVLLLGMMGLCAAPLLAVLRLAKLRLPAAVWWISALMAMFPGFVGSAIGLQRALEAISFVDPGSQGIIAHAGTAEGLVPAMAGLALAGLALVFAALLAGALSLTGADEDERAETRLAAAGALALGMPALVAAKALWSVRMGERALAFAAPEMRAMLNAAAKSEQLGFFGIFLAVAGVLLAFGMLMPVASRLGRPRVFVSLAVGGGALLLVGVLAGLTFNAARELQRFMPEQRQDELISRLPDLPRAVMLDGEDGQSESFALPVLQRQGDQWFDALDGRPLGPEESPYTAAFTASTPGQELTNLGVRSAELRLLVRVGPGLGAVPIWLEAPSETDDAGSRFDNALFLIEQDAGATLACTGCVERSLENLSEAPAKLEKLFSEESAADELVIVPGARFTVQDIVSLCLSAREATSRTRCTVMSRAPALAPPAPKLSSLSDMFSETAPIILGALSREAIAEVFRVNNSKLRYCYERQLVQQPDLSGKVVVKFVIAKDGSVSSANIKQSDPDLEVVGDCMTKQIARFRFPEPTGGGIVIVSYPFTFTTER